MILPLKIVLQKKVNKLKPGAKDMLLEGEVSLNKNKEGQIYFIIYRYIGEYIRHLIIFAETRLKLLNIKDSWFQRCQRRNS